jgi:hypothetical protein
MPNAAITPNEIARAFKNPRRLMRAGHSLVESRRERTPSSNRQAKRLFPLAENVAGVEHVQSKC